MRLWHLAVLFTVVPIVEATLLTLIGVYAGLPVATGIVLATGLLGAWLAKREGGGVWRKLRADLQTGLPPTGRIIEGLLVLVGGVLLVTPGVLTDLVGFALIIPWTRRRIAPWVTRLVVKWFTGSPEIADQVKDNIDFGSSPKPKAAEPVAPDPAPGRDPHFDHPVS